MKPLRIQIGLFAAFLLLAPMAPAAGEGPEQAAEQAAVAWLAMVDDGDYAGSWDRAASLFQAQVGEDDWVKALSGVRKPLGELQTREVISANYATSLPGAPDGEYVVLQFQTRFENKEEAVETVTPMLDGGEWKVSGYFIR